MAVEGLADLPDTPPPERAGGQRGRHGRGRGAAAAGPGAVDTRRVRATCRHPAHLRARVFAEAAVDRRGHQSPVQQQPAGVRRPINGGDRLGATQPATVSGAAVARLRRVAPAVISLALFFAALEVLRGELRHVTWLELTRDIVATSRLQLAAALALTVLNYAVLTTYDLLAFI